LSHDFVKSVESQELSCHLESLVWKLESLSSHMKLTIFSMFFCYKMAPNKLKYGAQCCFSRFVIGYSDVSFW